MLTTKYNPISQTLKSILGITQIIVSMSDLYSQPKRPGVCIMSSILLHNVICNINFFMFSYLAFVNHVTPGAGRFLPPGAFLI